MSTPSLEELAAVKIQQIEINIINIDSQINTINLQNVPIQTLIDNTPNDTPANKQLRTILTASLNADFIISLRYQKSYLEDTILNINTSINSLNQEDKDFSAFILTTISSNLADFVIKESLVDQVRTVYNSDISDVLKNSIITSILAVYNHNNYQ